jgi:hypothetical protein
MTRNVHWIALLAGTLISLPVLAKLPPPDPAQQAKADEAKAKTAWSDKVAAFQLCKAQDRVAARYFNDMKGSGKSVPPGTPGAPCADPGPFVAPTAAAAPAPAAAVAASPAPASSPAAAPPKPMP